MSTRHRAASLIALCLVALVATIPACGKKSTAPPGGGGAKELDSGNISPGNTHPHTFMNAGTFPYHCAIHGSGMAGTITVVGGGAASGAVSITNNQYNPPSLSVAPGATVTWTNNGSTHTVTSD